mmetsp:Transcript_6110/g.23754  ORF Transcript_6110/g.23754 Transcript_6110/m.23754 type:complete len:315 (-) Transcript_6110:31-975(-)
MKPPSAVDGLEHVHAFKVPVEAIDALGEGGEEHRSIVAAPKLIQSTVHDDQGGVRMLGALHVIPVLHRPSVARLHGDLDFGRKEGLPILLSRQIIRLDGAQRVLAHQANVAHRLGESRSPCSRHSLWPRDRLDSSFQIGQRACLIVLPRPRLPCQLRLLQVREHEPSLLAQPLPKIHAELHAPVAIRVQHLRVAEVIQGRLGLRAAQQRRKLHLLKRHARLYRLRHGVANASSDRALRVRRRIAAKIQADPGRQRGDDRSAGAQGAPAEQQRGCAAEAEAARWHERPGLDMARCSRGGGEERQLRPPVSRIRRC